MQRGTWMAVAVVCAMVLGAVGFAHAASARNGLDRCSSKVDIASLLPGGANEDPDVAATNAETQANFAAALAQMRSSPPEDLLGQLELLGKLALNDYSLSVNDNLACTLCHRPTAGFTGGVSLFNQTIVAQPGSVPITNATGGGPNVRISPRKPQSYAYAPFWPILHYDATQEDFYGGNFWDMRATGVRLGNPAAEQAQGPPVNPVEMGFPDTACAVYRLSQGPYRKFFEQVWGAHSFAITWPDDVETVCSTPGPAPEDDPFPVHLNAVDRAIANTTFDHLTMAIATYEAGPEVSPFSSKFDAFLAGNATLTPDEEAGWLLFRGKAKCNTCHLDGSANQGRKKAGESTPTDLAPLFSDFTSANLGLPKNLALPYYCEDTPDQFGYTANAEGFDFLDEGVGGMLSGELCPSTTHGHGLPPQLTSPPANCNPNEAWAAFAPQFDGKFQVVTLRNVDMRPSPDFVKAYMHNGYLKSLKEVVHFYNTRDALPSCPQGSPGEKVTCWPPSEIEANKDTTIGKLGLSEKEENQLVEFLKTLTDGFTSPAAASR
jgi:cytochrome c peroxidase